mmetsp:Transcript_108087/g.207753  ORF Transcript_108087/g.207753 Transcript_108087/m.207753 type:complete len:216 (-) Transcript_108087:104-751(-)
MVRKPLPAHPNLRSLRADVYEDADESCSTHAPSMSPSSSQASDLSVRDGHSSSKSSARSVRFHDVPEVLAYASKELTLNTALSEGLVVSIVKHGLSCLCKALAVPLKLIVPGLEKNGRAESAVVIVCKAAIAVLSLRWPRCLRKCALQLLQQGPRCAAPELSGAREQLSSRPRLGHLRRNYGNNDLLKLSADSECAIQASDKLHKRSLLSSSFRH